MKTVFSFLLSATSLKGTIKQRLIFSSLILMLSIFIISLISILKFSQLSNLLQDNTGTILKNSELQSNINTIELNATRLALTAMSGGEFELDQLKAHKGAAFKKIESILKQRDDSGDLETLVDDFRDKVNAFYKKIEEGNYLEGAEFKNTQVLECYSKLEKECAKISSGAIDEVSKNTHNVQSNLSNSSMVIMIIFVVSLILAILITSFVIKSIVTGLRGINQGLKVIGEGDLTRQLESGRQDELGQLTTEFNTFVDKLKHLMQRIIENTSHLNEESKKLSGFSDSLVDMSQQITEQSASSATVTDQMSANINSIATATEEMSTNISTISSEAEQMSQNMLSVAGAIEEMSSSIQDISNNAKSALDVTVQAKEMSINATGTMNTLGTAASEIGKVTDVIKRIAEQTNLLALNATIEAASAGEAGKGFAVVANEIKELAKQSANAAEDIATRIKGVQENTLAAITVIINVSKVTNDIGESVKVITNAVEQQNNTANEISSNVSQASTGAKNIANSIAEIANGANEMSRRTSEMASGATDVVTNIQAMSNASQDGNNNALKVNASSKDLDKIVAQLQTEVSNFKI